jgi:hypothetical protein
MDKPLGAVLVKKLASFALLVCFVLPLSKCTAKVDLQGNFEPTASYLYGFDLAEKGLTDLRDQKLDGAISLLAVFTVFFLPVFCMVFKARLQAILLLFAGLVSEYLLFCWVIVFATSPQMGGIVAMICWAILLWMSGATILRSWWRNTTLWGAGNDRGNAT